MSVIGKWEVRWLRLMADLHALAKRFHAFEAVDKSEDMPLPVESRTQVEAFKKSMEIQAFTWPAGFRCCSRPVGSALLR